MTESISLEYISHFFHGLTELEQSIELPTKSLGETGIFEFYTKFIIWIHICVSNLHYFTDN